MSPTELIHGAFRLLGVQPRPGRTASQEMLDEGLARLNDILDGWATQRLTIYEQTHTTYTFTANDGTYTLGSGGDFDQARPLWIDAITVTDADTSVESPLILLTDAQYAELSDKTDTATLPTSVHVHWAYPLAQLDYYPVPTEANTTTLYVPASPLLSVAGLDEELSLPPGYAKALRYALAVELAPEYGKALHPVVAAKAAESLADLKRVNRRIEPVAVDAALCAFSGGGAYNIYTDGYGR